MDYDKILPVVRAAHPAEMSPPKSPNLSPETKRLLESAVKISNERRDDYVGSEHLLLALVKGDDKSIRYLIREIKLEPSVVRSCVERFLEMGKDDLPATQPFVNDEETLKLLQTEPLKEQSSEPDMRTRVLQMVSDGKISATEGAELIKAMRAAAVPTNSSAGFLILPINGLNFEQLSQRTVRITVRNTRTGETKGEISLPFERAQSELFRLMRDVFKVSSGNTISVEGDQDRVEITLE
jgi:ATP-dependent Clp protease ATP-binding subunit ClpA